MVEKPGVLILTPFYEPNLGGVETHLNDLVGYLEKNDKYRVYVLTYQPLTTMARGAYFEKHKDIEIIRIPWIGFNLFHKLEPYPVLEFLYITPWLLLWSFIFLLVNGQNIRVIHAQGFNASFIGKLLSKVFGKRFVASTHAIYEMSPTCLMAKMVKWTLASADRVLTLSAASKQELIRIGLSAKNIETYTYWIDQQVFKPLNKDDIERIGGLQNKFIVLFVGRLIRLKGIDLLLEVARKVDRDIYFVFIGDGPLAGIIKEEAEKYPNIIFIGKIENQELPVYYCAADILCVPSKYEEGFGRVILEALACGTPVIASNRGGIPDALDKRVGLLVEPTADDFYKAVLYLFEYRDELESRRRLCRDYAVSRFGISNAEKILRAYEG